MPLAQRLRPAFPSPPDMAARVVLQAAVSAAGVLTALFAVGAAVHLRLVMRPQQSFDVAHVLEQGMDVAGGIGVAAVPAAVFALLAARSWPPFPGRRLAVATMAYAAGIALLLAEYGWSYPDVATDGLAYLYLGSAALVAGLTVPRAIRPEAKASAPAVA
jgi:hypothetical protein